MNVENNLEQNSNPYDDDQDSDLEARLYAEIHFSNNIIGEEADSTINNRTADVSSSDSYKLDNNRSTEKLLYQPKQSQNSNANNISSSSIRTSTSKRVQNENATNMPDSILQKRSIVNDSNELNKFNKKRKSEPGSSGQLKEHAPPVDSSKIMNPYNKNIHNDQMVGLPLLSPQLINLLFKVRPKYVVNQNKKVKLNNKNDNLPKNKVLQQSKTQTNSSRIITENQPTDRRIAQNSLEESSPVINISSEDSAEDDSKYSTTVATDKKLCKKKNVLTKSEESTSDSEESIFEVPVPPKPAPPVIDLKDSGSEVDTDSGSDSESSSSDSSVSENDVMQSKNDKCLNSTIIVSNNECNNDSTVNESENIILNCTEIQKGVSSLSEIKEMRQSTLNTKSNIQNVEVQQNTHGINICETENPSDQQNKSNNTGKDKVANTSYKKQTGTRPNSKKVSIEEYFFQPMNDKMKAFYNDSWGGENFNMDELKSKMSSDPKKWAILNTDIIASFVKRKRYFGMVCSRCHKDGHRQDQCTEVIKLPVCHMCGVTGHIEISCPKKMCLTCGKKHNMYRKTCESCRKLVCSRCQAYGHLSFACPDLWRRYHQTINNGNAEPPQNLNFTIKSANELQCCNCARRGHVSATCNKLRWSQHFPNPEYVTNYNGPPYFQDNKLSKNSNDAIKNSLNTSSIYDSSLNMNNTSINLESIREPSFQNQNLVTSPGNNTKELRNSLILEVKQKVFDEAIVLKSKTIEIKLHDNNASIDYENWTYLEKFLNSLANIIPAQFRIQQLGKKIKIDLKCQGKLQNSLILIIKDYASRNSIERSHMLMNCERRIQILRSKLTEKLNELNNLKEDPVKLYAEWKQLNWELRNKENRDLDRHNNFLKTNKLALCGRNLLMILYREGFLDDALKKLRLIYKKLHGKKYLKRPQSPVKNKDFFLYLHYYNNVFSPHSHPELNVAIQKFQEHLERCNRLKNNPLLFPQIQNEQVHSELNENVSSNDDCTAVVATSTPAIRPDYYPRASSSQLTTNKSQDCQKAVPETSYMSPTLPNYTSKASSSQFTSNRSQDHQNTVQEIQHNKNSDHLQYLKKHPRGLFLESVQGKGKGSKSQLTKKLNQFQAKTKKLINTAKKLNLPHLHKHIDILQKKMQNKIYVYEKDVKLLKKHVNEELNRRGKKRR